MGGIQLGSLCALSFGHPQTPLASLLAPTQSRRTRCNALRDHTPRGNDSFDRFTESFPRSAVPNQAREGFEILLERVRPTALPFHFPSPFCSLLPRFYLSLPLYEWMSGWTLDKGTEIFILNIRPFGLIFSIKQTVWSVAPENDNAKGMKTMNDYQGRSTRTITWRDPTAAIQTDKAISFSLPCDDPATSSPRTFETSAGTLYLRDFCPASLAESLKVDTALRAL